MASADKELQQAIEFIQQKNYSAGVMMLNAVLNRPGLNNQNRAIGYVWLAETQQDINSKIQYLSQAQDLDPQNPTIAQRLNMWLERQSRQTPYPTQRQAPQPPQKAKANPFLPDSMPIDLPPAENSESQEVRTIGTTQQDPYRTTENTFVQDEEKRSQILDHINPPPQTDQADQLPNLHNQSQWEQKPAYNPKPKRNLNDGRPNNPFAQPQKSESKPHKITTMPRVIGIKHGPNGNGSGVFVTLDGLIATTRSVVGGNLQVMVEIDTNYETIGQVIRSYPELDLALVHVNVELERVWPHTQVPAIMDGEAFSSISYDQDVVRGNHRRSGGQLDSHWITTTVTISHIKDAGGDAIYDSNNYLLGIMTRNASRETGYVYGLHILHIYDKVREYLRERQQMPNAEYCGNCGNLTQAQLYGGYYCETCGTLRPGMDKINRENRTSQQLLQVYNENLSRTCPRCKARVGYHNGKCLRCSYELEGRNKY